MSNLYDFISRVRHNTRQSFEKKYPYFFLLLRKNKNEPEEGWTFKTQTVSVITARLAQMAAQENIKVSPALSRYEVFPVQKALDNPWPERISVGRARNNDIVLPDSSVSKLHAHFKYKDNGSVFIIDADSRNGTRVNNTRLKNRQEVEITAEDSITFGRTNVTVLCGKGLYDFISKHIQPRS